MDWEMKKKKKSTRRDDDVYEKSVAQTNLSPSLKSEETRVSDWKTTPPSRPPMEGKVIRATGS